MHGLNAETRLKNSLLRSLREGNTAWSIENSVKRQKKKKIKSPFWFNVN